MEYKIREETLQEIADAIRSKNGKTEAILTADFAENIGDIDTSKPEETANVTLDFSGGDMELVPSTGSVFSKVNISKPETLLPGNIANGVDIAGIIGTLASGGNSSVKIASGKFSGTGTTGPISVEHGLNLTPDLILIRGVYGRNTTDPAYHLANGFGVSTAFRTVYNISSIGISGVKRQYTTVSTSVGIHNDGSTIDTTSLSPPINNANNKTFNFGGSDFCTSLGYEYIWIAIGGLT